MPFRFAVLAKVAIASFCSFAVTSCGIPRDPQLTTALVQDTGTIRLGWVEGAEADPHAVEALRKLRQRTGARLKITRADSETVFDDLAGGRIDLAYGILAKDNPWSKEVFGRALGWRARPPSHEPVSRFAMRNGENGWIMLVEEAAETSSKIPHEIRSDMRRAKQLERWTLVGMASVVIVSTLPMGGSQAMN